MKTYKINYSKSALKFLKKQPKALTIKIIKSIEKLPEGTDIKKLKGMNSLYRLRINKVRVIYSIYEEILTIEIINIDNRGDVYKNL